MDAKNEEKRSSEPQNEQPSVLLQLSALLGVIETQNTLLAAIVGQNSQLIELLAEPNEGAGDVDMEGNPVRVI